MTDFQFTLADRIQKIKSINEQYDLENNSYISFSGGKDSTILSHLIDQALPSNKIPRVFFDTGLEFTLIRAFIKDMAKEDNRVCVVASGVNIKEMLNEVGYPFKSKFHSHILAVYQHSGMGKTVNHYLSEETDENYRCPKKLRYQFSDDFKIKISDKCCSKLKKEIGMKWQIENNKKITITGMRANEKGIRNLRGGCVTFGKKDTIKFNPLFPLTDNFLDEYVKEFKVRLCVLYSDLYNFERTGCVGCPFNRHLRQDLEFLMTTLDSEAKRALNIWRPVYEEYARIHYRLYSETLEKLKKL